MTDGFLPYGRQTIEDDDIAAVAAALKSDLLTTGPLVEDFERAFADAVGAPHAVVCNSGTAALHMAVKAADLQPGEVCVVPAVTFVATANAARFEGGEVVFSDVDPETGLMTPDALLHALARAQGRRVRAILPVHLRGDPVALTEIKAIADRLDAVVIEDACHAVGTQSGGQPVGACAQSAMSCFSFHPVKTICTGEGGAVTTRDAGLAARLRMARNHGLTRDPAAFLLADEAFDDGAVNPWWYEQVELGWNYRLPDVNCALGLSQLKKLDRFAARRRELTALYRTALAPLAPLVRIINTPAGADPVLHLMQVKIDFKAAARSRREVMTRLKAKGVGSQVHYIPVHRQPYWRARYGAVDLPGADAFYAQILSLPLYPSLRDGDP
ncbi:MAG TPA: UDP-4-amino-4,6-dideoxy-N-acetyl-beta-L-altrosamine transaminase, partial [Caulobacteraceae bacterium]|nr:UDP-4-amino-4,6-dideoxy-N-acetyl-beta-L-altrosamine transaminase [Caulobacteraceae bacterium]